MTRETEHSGNRISTNPNLGEADMLALANIYQPGVNTNGTMCNCSNSKLVPNVSYRRTLRDKQQSGRYMSEREQRDMASAKIEVPCRKCDGCKMLQRKQKSDRLQTEVEGWGQGLAHMVTLTKDKDFDYSYTKSLPPTELSDDEQLALRRKGYAQADIETLKTDGWPSVPTLDHSEIQQLMNRIRRYFHNKNGEKIFLRYQITGEYGTARGARKNGNPHYHMLIGGLTAEQLAEVFGPFCNIQNDNERNALFKQYQDSGLWARTIPNDPDCTEPLNQWNSHQIARGAVHVLPVHNDEGEMQDKVVQYITSYVQKQSVTQKKSFIMYGRKPEYSVGSTGSGKRGKMPAGIPEHYRGPIGASALAPVIDYIRAQTKVEARACVARGEKLSINTIKMIAKSFSSLYPTSTCKGGDKRLVGDWVRRHALKIVEQSLLSLMIANPVECRNVYDDYIKSDDNIIVEKGKLESAHVDRLKTDSEFRENRNELRDKSAKQNWHHRNQFEKRQRMSKANKKIL